RHDCAMSPSRRGKRRPGKGKGTQKQRQFWDDPTIPTDSAPIVPAVDPTTLIRSLDSPPVPGDAAVLHAYLAAVVERAAQSASALAKATGILAGDEADLSGPAE